MTAGGRSELSWRAYKGLCQGIDSSSLSRNLRYLRFHLATGYIGDKERGGETKGIGDVLNEVGVHETWSSLGRMRLNTAPAIDPWH